MQAALTKRGQREVSIAALAALFAGSLLTAAEARESLTTLRHDLDLNTADVAVLSTLVPVASDEVILVNSLADIADAADGVCTLREAIAAANDAADAEPAIDGECDTGSNDGGRTQIDLRLLAGAIVLEDALPTITADLIIEGPGKNALAIDGAGSYPILSIGATAVVVLDALTLRNAAGASGGAIRNSGDLTVTDSIFTGNDGGSAGGAIKSDAVALFVSGSTFFDNSADQGGAINAADGSSVALLSNVIYANSATEDGGAIFIGDIAAATIAGSTIFANSAGDDGGAIHFGGTAGTFASIRNTLVDNTAGEAGGAIACGGSDIVALVSESTLYGNAAGTAGGAIRTSGTVNLQLYRNLFGVPQPNAAPLGPNVNAEPNKVAESNLPSALGCDGTDPNC